MKNKRFMTEYASYKKQEIRGNPWMLEVHKKVKTNLIDNILKYSERGLITIDEAMSDLSNI